MLKQSIGFVGGGQMARALAGGMVDAGLIRGDQIWVYDPQPTAVEQFTQVIGEAHAADSNAAVARRTDAVILAVKPQHLAAAAADLRGELSSEKLVISIAAGVTLARLGEVLGHDRLVRVMPNTPCLVRQGAAGYALGPAAGEDDANLVDKLLGAVGMAVRLDEPLLDAVTGLSGSGPAFVYTIIEALADGGLRMGLPRATAQALAVQTVRGAAEMVAASGDHPAVLRDRVSSPGGTTIAGLFELEQHGLRAALMAAVEAATLRSRELGQND